MPKTLSKLKEISRNPWGLFQLREGWSGPAEPVSELLRTYDPGEQCFRHKKLTSDQFE